MDTYFNHSELAAVRGITSATWALALIAVMLRFTARRMSKSGLWYDDYMIIIALVQYDHNVKAFSFTEPCLRSVAWDCGFILSYGVNLLDDKSYGSLLIWALPVSTRVEEPPDSVSALTRILKCAFIANLIWIVTLSSTKLSILLLYMRLFAQRVRSRWASRIFVSIVICWGVIGVGEHFRTLSKSVSIVCSRCEC